jgi:ABC-type glycerol-3-phosphate transport system substrate-binding protein
MIHWGDIHEISLMRDVIKSMKTEKNIDVKQFRANSGETYMEKVLTQFAAGDAPDVIFTEVNNFKEFADKGVLVDLMPYIKRDGLDMNDYYRQIIERFTIDGKLYVLPRDIAPICVIYYNKKFFDQAGIPYPKSDWNRAKRMHPAGP